MRKPRHRGEETDRESESVAEVVGGGGGGLVAKSCPALGIPWIVAVRLLCPWDSPGKNTGVGCHFLLQGIFPTQESNTGLLHCRQMIYQLTYEGSPAGIRIEIT